jgi:pimeloyl-[acyl-carrier protein] methyl ester esterase
MKTYIKRRERNDRLVVVYGGWGNDENMFTHLCSDESDFILFSHYSADEPMVLPEMKMYNKKVVIGWSLGVWAAEYLTAKTGIIPDLAIAVNGTPVPADDRYGIPMKSFEGTLNNITDRNMTKFYLRMFGDKKTYRANQDRVPMRTVKSLSDELRWLYNRIMEPKESLFKWNIALISEKDRIFPTENLLAYWKTRPETLHIEMDQPHYLFHSWKSFDALINFAEEQLDKDKNR